MIHIWFSHVHFAYWKIEAFQANEPFRSLLQVTVEFSSSCCFLPWWVELSLEAFPFSLKEGLRNTRGLEIRPLAQPQKS